MKASRFRLIKKKKMYKNIAFLGILLFSFYICYKTYQTQQRKLREGFKEGLAAKETDSSSPSAAKDAIAQAIADCQAACPTDKSQCPPVKDCDKTDKDCKKDSAACASNVSECKKICTGSKKK
jgi:hypothetical protein